MADGGRVRRAMFMGAVAALVVAAIYVLLRQKHTPDLLVQSDEGWQPDVRVSVAGEVLTPGTYTLRGDARVNDLIAAAGGYTDKAERNAFNPAARLGDGQQYIVPTQTARTATAAARTTATTPPTPTPGSTPTPESTPAPTSTTAAANTTTTTAATTAPTTTAPPARATAAATRVNINTATKEDLEALPAIGPAIAQRIIDDRTAHGPYKRIEDLVRVSGISARTVEQLRDLITVGP